MLGPPPEVREFLVLSFGVALILSLSFYLQHISPGISTMIRSSITR